MVTILLKFLGLYILVLKKWSFPTKIHTVVALQNRRNRRGDQFPYFVKSVNALSIRGWGQFIPTTLILAHPNFHTFLRSLTKMHTCARESPKLSVCTRKQYHNEIHVFYMKRNIISDTYEIHLITVIITVFKSIALCTKIFIQLRMNEHVCNLVH